MTQWYVVHTHPRSEEIACRNLARQGFEIFLPRYLRRRSHARRVENVAAPLFPGYIFVAVDMERARWRAISSTIGVNHVVCCGDAPLPVPLAIVDEIRARMDSNGFIQMLPRVAFRPGEAVQVTGGPLTDQVGLFECLADGDRIILLFNILGRKLKVAAAG
jgi:transcriptional antiterminator RfaH